MAVCQRQLKVLLSVRNQLGTVQDNYVDAYL